MRASPPLSVVMPVRNAEPYLDASIGSILEQTYGDFEMVCFDDGSTDRSLEMLHEWARKDCRIRVYTGERPLGPTGVSNRIVELARAPLLARMDADDVSLPTRLERQVEVFREHRDVAAVATLFEGIDESGRQVRPADRWRLLRGIPLAPFAHGSVMISRAHFDAVGGYRVDCDYWEDLDLCYRLARRGRVMVLPQALYQYRFRLDSSRMTETPQLERAVETMWQCVAEERAGRDYEAILARAASLPNAGEPPRLITIVLLAAPRLWAGQVPRVLGHPRLRRDLSLLKPGAFPYLVYAVWADWHSPSLRWSLRAFIRMRDWVAGWWVGVSKPYEWRPGGRRSAAVKGQSPCASGAVQDQIL